LYHVAPDKDTMRTLFLAVTFLGFAQVSSAQQQSVRVGDRVRLWYFSIPDDDAELRRVRAVGRLDSLARDTAFISTRAIPLSNVSNVNVSIGRQPDVLRDFTIGLVLGAAIGQIMVNRKLNKEVFPTPADLDARKKELRSQMLLFAAVAGGAGALIGRRGHEAWANVDPQTLRSAAGSTGAGGDASAVSARAAFAPR
jgi:hypothetical protein